MNYQRRRKGKLKARRVLRIWRASAGAQDTDLYAGDGLLAQGMLRTRVLCSCLYCGNPRRHFGQVTRQEQLADLREREQVGELELEL